MKLAPEHDGAALWPTPARSDDRSGSRRGVRRVKIDGGSSMPGTVQAHGSGARVAKQQAVGSDCGRRRPSAELAGGGVDADDTRSSGA
jgi:hypothetical protein